MCSKKNRTTTNTHSGCPPSSNPHQSQSQAHSPMRRRQESSPDGLVALLAAEIREHRAREKALMSRGLVELEARDKPSSIYQGVVELEGGRTRSTSSVFRDMVELEALDKPLLYQAAVELEGQRIVRHHREGAAEADPPSYEDAVKSG